MCYSVFGECELRENAAWPSLTLPEEGLRAGIWPRSVVLWLAGFYVALFVIRPWEQLFPWLAAFHFERCYAIFMVCAVLLSGQLRLPLTPQTGSVLLFLGAFAISACCAIEPSLAWTPLYVYFTLVVFYYVLISVIRSPYKLVFIVTCYLVAMGLYLAKAQWEYFVHGAHQSEMGVRRLVGIERTFGNDNNLAQSIVLSLPWLCFLYLTRDSFTATWPRSWRRLFIWGLGCYAFLAVTSVLLTRSRAGALGLVAFLVLSAARGKGIARKARKLLITTVLVLCVFPLLPADIQNRIRTIWDPQAGPQNAYTSKWGRWYGFLAGLQMFQDHPITGVGIGNFNSYRVKYVDGSPLSAHSLFGELLGETGAVGAVAFAVMVLTTLVYCHRTRRLAANAQKLSKAWVLGEVALACRDTILLLFFYGLSGHNLTRFNWLWIGAFALLAWEFMVQDLAWCQETTEECG